jgi:hypothetical protein
MKQRIFYFLLVAVIVSLAPSSKAAVPPENVAKQVEEAAQSCRDMGGKPGTEAMLTVSDINGDGIEDWVVDYAKLQCAGMDF